MPPSRTHLTTLHFAAAASRPARSSIRKAWAGLLLIRLTQSQSRLIRKNPRAAFVASVSVEATHPIRDPENLRTVPTLPLTIGQGVRGQSRIDGVHARSCRPASA